MVNEILTASGIAYAQGRFIRPPVATYAVYFDDVKVSAVDRVPSLPSTGLPRIYTHSVTVELYEPSPDEPSEHALEAELDARGLEWEKEDRYWLNDTQRYQVIYRFNFTSK